MKQYSIEAMASKPVAIPEPLAMLDEGFNAFTVMTDEIEEFVDLLRAEGVTVQKVHFIGQEEVVSIEDELLPGETLGLDGRVKMAPFVETEED